MILATFVLLLKISGTIFVQSNDDGAPNTGYIACISCQLAMQSNGSQTH